MKQALAARYAALMDGLPKGAEGLHVLGQALRDDFQCDRVTLYLKGKHGVYVSIYAEGLAEMILAVKRGEGVVGKAIASKRPYLANNAVYDPNSLSRLRDHYSGYETQSLLVVPIPGHFFRPQGAIQLVNKLRQPFSEADMRRLTDIAPLFRSIERFRPRPLNNCWQSDCHKESHHVAVPSA